MSPHSAMPQTAMARFINGGMACSPGVFDIVAMIDVMQPRMGIIIITVKQKVQILYLAPQSVIGTSVVAIMVMIAQTKYPTARDTRPQIQKKVQIRGRVQPIELSPLLGIMTWNCVS